MAQAGAVDIPVEVFGSLVTDRPDANLPVGTSPNNQDCQFFPGGVLTRPGLRQTIQNASSLTYLKTFTDTLGINHTLYLDVNGKLWDTATPITNTILPNQLCKSVTGFGREYFAFSDGKSGVDFPRQYDGFNLDRVTQEGPGAAPIAQDITYSQGIISVSPNIGNIAGLSSNGNIVTISAGANTFLGSQPNDSIVIAGNADGYNGTLQVLNVIDAANVTALSASSGLPASSTGTVNTGLVSIVSLTLVPTLSQSLIVSGVTDATYNGTFPERFTFHTGFHTTNIVYNPANSGIPSSGGTVAIVGNITAGKHYLTVYFVTRNGYWTKFAVPSSWTAAGGQQALITGIPTGPLNVVARILAFSAAGAQNFFTIQNDAQFPGMLINDNVTTSVTVDFADSVLLAGLNVDYLGNMHLLGACSGVMFYNQRLAWWGERNTLPNMVNLTFDGGFGGNLPLGWTLDVSNGAGGSQTTALGGLAYRITGDGATNMRGMIYQGAIQDYLGTLIFDPSQEGGYSVRVRCAQSGGLLTGTLEIDLYSPSTGIIYGIFGVGVTQMTTQMLEFSGQLTLGFFPQGFPPDLVMRVYSSNTLPVGSIVVKNIEPFPTRIPTSDSVIRWSYAQEPEAIDTQTGIMQISPQDGQRLTNVLTLPNGYFYPTKEGSLWSSIDDGTNEPSLWKALNISSTVGAASVHSAGAYEGEQGESWIILLNRMGAFLYDGSGQPDKISQEIQLDASNSGRPCWAAVNAQAMHTSWVTIDITNRRMLYGLPMFGASNPNIIFQMDFKTEASPAAVDSASPIYVSAYTGRILSKETQRKWSPWSIAANCGALIETSNGTAQLVIGVTGAENYPSGPTPFPYPNYSLAVTPDGGGYQFDPAQLFDTFVVAGVPVSYPIYCYYMTAYLPDAGARNALQQILTASRVLMSYLTFYCIGNGNLSLFTILPGLTVAQSLPNPKAPPLTLSNPAVQDFETFINTAGERIGLLFTATYPPLLNSAPNNVGNWFQISKLNASISNDPATPWRGVN